MKLVVSKRRINTEIQLIFKLKSLQVSKSKDKNPDGKDCCKNGLKYEDMVKEKGGCKKGRTESEKASKNEKKGIVSQASQKE